MKQSLDRRLTVLERAVSVDDKPGREWTEEEKLLWLFREGKLRVEPGRIVDASTDQVAPNLAAHLTELMQGRGFPMLLTHAERMRALELCELGQLIILEQKHGDGRLYRRDVWHSKHSHADLPQMYCPDTELGGHVGRAVELWATFTEIPPEEWPANVEELKGWLENVVPETEPAERGDA